MVRLSQLRKWANRDNGKHFRAGNTALGPLVALGALLLLAALVAFQFTRAADVSPIGSAVLAGVGVVLLTVAYFRKGSTNSA